MEGALVHGTIAEEADDALRQVAHGNRISDANRDRAGFADDRIAAHEAALAVEHMHRAAHAAGHAVGAAEKLGHHLSRRHATHQRMGVLAIGADDIIGRAGGVNHACSDGFLAGIKMEETDDIALRIFLCSTFLKSARQKHVAKKSM